MSLFNQPQAKSLKAFLTALHQQDESLPSGLQKQLYAIGQNLENRVVELPTVAASLPDLQRSYQAALGNVGNSESNQRATLVSTGRSDERSELRDRAIQIFTDPDPVKAAQKSVAPGIGPIATNPLKRIFGRG